MIRRNNRRRTLTTFHEVNDHAIIQAVLEGKKPAGLINIKSRHRFTTLRSSGISVRKCWEIGGPKSVFIISKNGAAAEILRDAENSFRDFHFIDRLRSLAREIKEKSIIDAVIYLLNHPCFEIYPEFSVCAGLLFGYPLCCIRYYAKTRYTNKPLPLTEEKGRGAGRVLCEACREIYKKAKN